MSDYETRIVRRFLWWPLRLQNGWRWLQWAWIEEQCYRARNLGGLIWRPEVFTVPSEPEPILTECEENPREDGSNTSDGNLDRAVVDIIKTTVDDSSFSAAEWAEGLVAISKLSPLPPPAEPGSIDRRRKDSQS